jgi:8-amino-7-oxononanoate synthase
VADLAVGTFGKAFGLFGAFVLLPHDMREYLINFSSPLIYTTTLPEAHGASILNALEMVVAADNSRLQLAKVSATMQAKLQAAGFEAGGNAHIIAVHIGSEAKATALCRHLFKKGVFVFSARFPTVPLNQAILRISMTAEHTPEDVNALVTGLLEAQDAIS